MKVISVTYQSVKIPSKIAMYTTAKQEDKESAIAAGLLEVNAKEGDLDWRALLSNQIDVSVDLEKEKQSKNWLLSTIISNKDKSLLRSAKKYLTDPELKLIKDKIK